MHAALGIKNHARCLSGINSYSQPWRGAYLVFRLSAGIKASCIERGELLPAARAVIIPLNPINIVSPVCWEIPGPELCKVYTKTDVEPMSSYLKVENMKMLINYNTQLLKAVPA